MKNIYQIRIESYDTDGDLLSVECWDRFAKRATAERFIKEFCRTNNAWSLRDSDEVIGEKRYPDGNAWLMVVYPIGVYGGWNDYLKFSDSIWAHKFKQK